MSFTSDITPLTRRERTLFWILAILVAATRVWARAKSLWDWDEALFCTALRDFNVAMHQPHPPGFPGYVAVGKLLYAITGNEFRSLQLINIAAACTLFPSAFKLARELRLSFVASIAAALMLVFAGNVWVFGGSAFSDVPALALLLATLAFLLHGCRSSRAFFVGSFLAAVLLTIRPQMLMVVALPWAVAAFFALRRRTIEPCLALLMIITIDVVAYGSVAYVTGFDAYQTALASHKRYLVEVDSYANPNRPPLSKLVGPTFVTVTKAGSADHFVTLLALVGLVAAAIRRSAQQLLLFVAYTPFLLFAWAMLDINSYGRYSIGYVPLYALLAAGGIDAIARVARSDRARRMTAAAMTILLVVPMILWSAPAIAEVRRYDSPPVRAIQWIRKNADPKRDVVVIHGGLAPHANFLMPEFRRETTPDVDTIPLSDHAFVLTDQRLPVRGARIFSRPRGRLWGIVRHFYFDVTVVPTAGMVRFGEGWYARESEGDESWRWMGESGTIELPPIDARRGRLRLRFAIPSNLLDEPVTVTVSQGNIPIDTLVTRQEEIDRTIELDVTPGVPQYITIRTSRVTNLAAEGIGEDGRDLGIRMRDVIWLAVHH